MNLYKLAAVIVMALCTFSAKAGVFDFSYTFGSGDVVSGSLSGTQNGNFVDNVSNVSVFFNGNPFIGNPNLYQPYYALEGCCFLPGAPVISFDANLNNFSFSDAPPNTPAANYFNMNGTDKDFWWTGDRSPLRYAMAWTGTVSVGDVTANSPTYPGANGEFNAAKWSLNAVPEPATLALMSLGMLGVVVSRRRKNLDA